jgi:hypothetical protein
LLGTQALKGLIAGDPVFSSWLEARGSEVVHVSLASVALLMACAEAMTNVANRRAWIERLSEDIPAKFGPRLHGFDLAAAKQWSAVRAGLTSVDAIEECDLFVIAVALAQDLDYVAPREEWHSAVNNLRQHDPWASKSYPN